MYIKLCIHSAYSEPESGNFGEFCVKVRLAHQKGSRKVFWPHGTTGVAGCRYSTVRWKEFESSELEFLNSLGVRGLGTEEE
jgi:hypothetical protein